MFAVCCCSLLTLASSSVYKPRLVFPAQLIRTKTSGVRAGEGICSEHSPLTQPRAARLNRTRPNPPNPRFSGEPWLFLFCLSHACSVRLGPHAPVLGDPKSQGWVPLPQWNSRLEIKVPVLSSALPCPKESGRDSCPLSHHGDSAFCRNARTFQLPGGKSSLPDTPSERCPSDTSLTPLLPISDTAGRKEINQSRTRGRQEGAQEGERFWTVPGLWGSGGLGWGGAAAYLSQEGGAHCKQLMHWRVKAPQLALMMQSGREEEGPEVLAESAPTYTQGAHSLRLTQWPLQTHQCTHSTDSLDHARPWVHMHSLHKLLVCIWFAIRC